MCLSGLIDSKSEFRLNVLGSFPGREVVNLLFNFFEGSNEEIMGKRIGYMVKCGGSHCVIKSNFNITVNIC